MNFEEIIEKEGILVYPNVGTSMLPLLREGKDVMVIEKIKEPLKKYDAVLFFRDGIEGRGKYALHRITKINNDDTYIIEGDACYNEKEIVRKDHIIGLLTGVKRNGKLVTNKSFKYLAYVYIWWGITPIRYFFDFLLRTYFKIRKKVIGR